MESVTQWVHGRMGEAVRVWLFPEYVHTQSHARAHVVRATPRCTRMRVGSNAMFTSTVKDTNPFWEPAHAVLWSDATSTFASTTYVEVIKRARYTSPFYSDRAATMRSGDPDDAHTQMACA